MNPRGQLHNPGEKLQTPNVQGDELATEPVWML